jgi:hypothetical protein
MYTLSITQARQKLSETVASFEGVTAYKVEFGLWDFSEKPYVQLYVNCSINGQNQFIHAQGTTFVQAIEELKNWYHNLAKQQLVLLSEDLMV